MSNDLKFYIFNFLKKKVFGILKVDKLKEFDLNAIYDKTVKNHVDSLVEIYNDGGIDALASKVKELFYEEISKVIINDVMNGNYSRIDNREFRSSLVYSVEADKEFMSLMMVYLVKLGCSKEYAFYLISQNKDLWLDDMMSVSFQNRYLQYYFLNTTDMNNYPFHFVTWKSLREYEWSKEMGFECNLSEDELLMKEQYLINKDKKIKDFTCEFVETSEEDNFSFSLK